MKVRSVRTVPAFQITDPLNHITTLTYNAQGLIASITDAQNHTTTYGYDPRGNRISVIDPVNSARLDRVDSNVWSIWTRSCGLLEIPHQIRP